MWRCLCVSLPPGRFGLPGFGRYEVAHVFNHLPDANAEHSLDLRGPLGTSLIFHRIMQRGSDGLVLVAAVVKDQGDNCENV